MSDSSLYDAICKNECRNTHHKLVMNSLQHLSGSDADKWRSVFIRHFEFFLEGSKDPDTKFRDFRNHVLHVSDNFWGGPVKQAEKWYASTIEHLKNEDWKSAVYSAGVMSHYYMDPIMPLHTGQTEEEGVIHRACEWSVNKSFDSLISLLENGAGYPTVDLPSGNDWLKGAIHAGAILAHGHYQSFIDHYNLELGSKNPPAGLDGHLQEVTSGLLGYASVGFARILERAFAESSAIPGHQSTSLLTMFYRATAPFSWCLKAAKHVTGRRQVQRIAAEYQATGKVVDALPHDEKQVRGLHASEILKIDIEELDAREIGPVGSKASGQPGTRRVRQKPSRDEGQFRLDVNEPLEKAPSIGAKTAKRFQDVGIETVADFLAADAEETASALGTKNIKASTITQWQTQTTLACQIPRIYGHDAQILAGCGFESATEVARSDPEMILSLVNEFVKTREASFVIRDGRPPDLKEVTNWVEWSKQSRKIKVA